MSDHSNLIQRITDSVRVVLDGIKSEDELTLLAENLETLVRTYSRGRFDIDTAIEVLIEDFTEAIG